MSKPLWWVYPEQHPAAGEWSEDEFPEVAALNVARGWAMGGMCDFVIIVEDAQWRRPRRFHIEVTVAAKEQTEENT